MFVGAKRTSIRVVNLSVHALDMAAPRLLGWWRRRQKIA
jgi:hypothetical protein